MPGARVQFVGGFQATMLRAFREVVLTATSNESSSMAPIGPLALLAFTGQTSSRTHRTGNLNEGGDGSPPRARRAVIHASSDPGRGRGLPLRPGRSIRKG